MEERFRIKNYSQVCDGFGMNYTYITWFVIVDTCIFLGKVITPLLSM
jgi:hypothetical protein